jgi:hypothetical protein
LIEDGIHKKGTGRLEEINSRGLAIKERNKRCTRLLTFHATQAKGCGLL